MSSPTLTNILRLRGRFIKGNPNLTGTFPFGGTELGLTRNGRFRFDRMSQGLTMEEFGGIKGEEYYAGEKAVMNAILRDFDADMISAIFLESGAAGLVTRTKTGVRGQKLSDLADIITFAPVSELQPFVVFYNAMPMIQEASEIQMAANVEVGFPVQWEAIPDSNGRVFSFGPKATIPF